LALILISCGKRGPSPDSEAGANAALSAFVDSYFTSYFNFNPSEATSVGLHDYDSRLEERNAARIQARIAELQSQANEIESLRKKPLGFDEAIDATLLANRIQAELLDLNSIHVWRSPLYYAGIPGNAVDLLMKRNFAPPPARLASVTARLRQVPALIQAMRDNTAEPPKEFTELALRIVKGSVPFFREAVPEWAKTAAGQDQKLMAEFNDANRKAVTSLSVMSDHLERNVLPLSTGAFAIGADQFSSKLKYEEMVDTPLDKLLKTGEAQLERDYKAFIETAKRVAPGRKPTDAVNILSAEHPALGQLMQAASSTLEDVRKFVVDHKIIPIPSEERAKVTPTPPYARAGVFAAMDTPGPYETKATEAFYYVTPTEPDWTPPHKLEHLKLYNRPVMDIITIHEAYPGHYVQFLYAKQFPTKTRKLISCGTNAEGWAHYAEQMMVEEGFGNGDPKILLAQLSEALVRDARYVAGIKLHTAGWTVDEAAKLFVEKAFMEPANALEEARRGTYNPTYLYYTLGKLEIYDLREDYRRAKGNGFSLSQFHQDFVKQGAIPIPLIRTILLAGK
jgi:hypothetical protein